MQVTMSSSAVFRNDFERNMHGMFLYIISSTSLIPIKTLFLSGTLLGLHFDPPLGKLKEYVERRVEDHYHSVSSESTCKMRH